MSAWIKIATNKNKDLLNGDSYYCWFLETFYSLAQEKEQMMREGPSLLEFSLDLTIKGIWPENTHLSEELCVNSSHGILCKSIANSIPQHTGWPSLCCLNKVRGSMAECFEKEEDNGEEINLIQNEFYTGWWTERDRH